MYTHRIRLYASAFVISLLLSINLAAAENKLVTDTENRVVSVPDNPQRVLLGFYFEDFYAIVGPGAYDRVVAISKDTWAGWRAAQWQRYLAVAPRLNELVDIGEVDSGTFNIEAAVAVKPDVAILAAWQFKALGNTVDKLEAAGIPVVVADFNAQTVEKHEKSALLIGQVMGAEARARKLADEYKNAVADVQARVDGVGGQKKRVYVELGNKGAGEIGNSYGNTMWGRVIELAGGENIAADKIDRWAPLSPEYVLAQNPELIIIPGSEWLNRPNAVHIGFGVDAITTETQLRPYTLRPGWSSLDAVKNGEVHSLYHGGTRTLYDYAFLQYIAKRLYPAAFEGIDPAETLRGFYRSYLPIEADGVFTVRLPPAT